jgi:hypothetical protein
MTTFYVKNDRGGGMVFSLVVDDSFPSGVVGKLIYDQCMAVIRIAGERLDATSSS